MAASLRVLVVDDDPGIRETMFDILSLEGYQVEVADSGERALELSEKGRYDVALLDIRMPGIDGVETLRALKRTDSAIRVIMITGFDEGDLAAKAMEAGAEAVFRKPLDVATFLPLLMASTPG
ncbi:MAG TPA: response regulator [Chloroflexi bacterium]|jgi:CheY-like chemotaxis protein|nr:response regulator [Chloroflexota bacterium]